MKKITRFIPLLCALVYAATRPVFYEVFANNWDTVKYGILMVIYALLMVITVLFFRKSRLGENRTELGRSIGLAALWLVFGMIFPTVMLNNVLRIGESNVCSIVLPINDIVFITLSAITLKRKRTNAAVAVIGCLLCAVIGFLPIVSNTLLPIYYLNYSKTEVAPVNLSSNTKKGRGLVDDADFYVSPNGSDQNDGSRYEPFLTIEKARNAVRKMNKKNKDGITVAIMAGEYRTKQLLFTKKDSGTQTCPISYCAYGNGEVILNGGISIKPDDFSPVTDSKILERLDDAAKDKIVCTDLKQYGLTADDWGKIYAIGSYNTAAKYDGDYVGGLYCELFFNDKRMTIARYPNDGWLKTDKIVETGDGYEKNGATTKNENWENVKNPKGDTYQLDTDTASRVAHWKDIDNVWMFGFFKYTWADASTLIESFDEETGNLTTKFVSLYGTDKTAPYYFFNILEELDTEGEWYLDRNTGMLYMIAPESMSGAVIDLSLTNDTVIKTKNTNYLTFDNLTVKGTRDDAVEINGNHNTVSGCLIKNVGGNALIMNGYKNLASENEITHTGKGGIYISGGERKTLKSGNSKADNNLIHDWSEIYQTYQPAVTLSGVGNTCSHNEIYNSPHEAITYSGNNHVIEYNNIHNVCLLSDDAGAIYAGRHWDFYGTVIRYNCIADIYGDGHKACGIYLDDALSGQTVYGNFLINVGSIGIHLGGGRDLIVKNNILVNCNDRAFSYDDRAREGAINNGWFNHSSQKDGDMWTNLFASPWETEVWQQAYPQYAKYSDDFSDTNNPDFVPNPSYSELTDNLVVNVKGELGSISDAASRFSTIENNAVFRTSATDKIFENAQQGDYKLNKNSTLLAQYEQIEDIPFEQIGRY